MSIYKYYIGIDTGTNTGFAVWNKADRKFVEICTVAIHEAFEKVLSYHHLYGDDLFVRFEDARLRTWFGRKVNGKWVEGSVAQLQGAGSIKRDCNIWDDFLKDKKIHYASTAPKLGLTKMDPDRFKLFTGWKEKTSDHARDAAMLVFGI
jgi:hypothetical protein